MDNKSKFDTNRLTILIIVGLLVLSIYGILAGWLIYVETTTVYTDVYNRMSMAGLNSILSVPEINNYRMMVLMMIIPLVGIGLVLPICWKINKEFHLLYDELNRYRNPFSD